VSIGEKIARGGGPEPTKYDRDRHAKMQLRDQKYGQIRVFQNQRLNDLCCKCGLEIVMNQIVVFGRNYHGRCFHLENSH
jgi:hypothetical protein